MLNQIEKLIKMNKLEKYLYCQVKKLKSDVLELEEGGGPGGESYLTITKTQLDTAVTNSTLVPGTLYGVTEAERWMLLGDSTDTLYLRAITSNRLEPKGTGKFFVPKYDKAIDGYGIWQGEVYAAFPTTVTEPVYAIGDKVIWGGRLWNNVTGLLGTKIDIYNLSEDWEIIPFDKINYNIRFDKIEYDFDNDMVIYRKDDNGNEVSTSYQDWYFKENDYFNSDPLNISLYNSLKIYQWGNEFDYDLGKGCGFNIVTNSVLECLNTYGQIHSNTLENNGYIYSNTLNNGQISSNTLENNGQIYSNVLNNGQIYSNTLENNGYIHSNTLNNGQIHSNTLNNGQISSNTLNNGQIYSNTLNNGQISLGLNNSIDGKNIQYLTINNGDIGGVSGIDLTNATLVYEGYTREVFKNSVGVTKIRYINDTGITIIADLTD